MAMEMAIAKSAGGKLKLHTKRETLLNKSESASKFRNHLLSRGQKHTKKRTTTTATTTWKKKQHTNMQAHCAIGGCPFLWAVEEMQSKSGNKAATGAGQ